MTCTRPPEKPTGLPRRLTTRPIRKDSRNGTMPQNIRRVMRVPKPLLR
ncbi:hypothetical protein LJY25_08540 [Hymenobacter sp. BT175]|nr:hypothetical protein [Hymenobacter translucens]MCC2546488.1 hypothetical protein [Hymenobacter translucens]